MTSILTGTIASSKSGHLAVPIAGAMDALATVTVPSGSTAASITFSGIPNTYQHLQIRGIAQSSTSQDNVRLQFNGDTGNNYAFHGLYGTGAAGGAESGASIGNIPTEMTAVSASNYANVFGAGIIDILDYASVTKNKVTRSTVGQDAGSTGSVAMGSGLWMNTNAITSITLKPSTYLFGQYTTFSLYGMK